MKIMAAGIVLLFFAGSARAECTDEIRKPQKPHDVARIDWMAAGRKWQVVLSWGTESVSDNGEEEATVILFVRDNIKHPLIGDARNYYLTPNRCNKPIDPSLSTVKLMGRDFLLVTLPEREGVVISWMYSIDASGHLTQVFHGAYEGHYLRTPLCRNLLRSFIRPENADGSRFAWVYEAPGIEWAWKKSECAKAKIERVAFIYEWKNGCFAVVDQPDPSGHRLITQWDKEECVMGVGLVTKPAAHDGSLAPAPAAPPSPRAPIPPSTGGTGS